MFRPCVVLSFIQCVCVYVCVCVNSYLSHIYYVQYNVAVCWILHTVNTGCKLWPKMGACLSVGRVCVCVCVCVCLRVFAVYVHGSVPDLKEAVPGPGGHRHAVIRHTQTAHTIVMAGQDSCRRDEDKQKKTCCCKMFCSSDCVETKTVNWN